MTIRIKGKIHLIVGTISYNDYLPVANRGYCIANVIYLVGREGCPGWQVDTSLGQIFCYREFLAGIVHGQGMNRVEKGDGCLSRPGAVGIANSSRLHTKVIINQHRVHPVNIFCPLGIGR
jgi:hypothetical protein